MVWSLAPIVDRLCFRMVAGPLTRASKFSQESEGRRQFVSGLVRSPSRSGLGNWRAWDFVCGALAPGRGPCHLATCARRWQGGRGGASIRAASVLVLSQGQVCHLATSDGSRAGCSRIFDAAKSVLAGQHSVHDPRNAKTTSAHASLSRTRGSLRHGCSR